MPKNSLMAGAARFASLAGWAGAKPRAEETDDKDKTVPAEDAGAHAGEGDDCPACDGTGEDADGKECEACDGTGEKPADSAAEGDDDDQTEMRGRSDAAKARRRERERCAAIFAHPAAAKNLVAAAHLAFETNMTRNQAIAALEAEPAPVAAAPPAAAAPVRRGPPVRTDRADRNPTITPGAPEGGGKGSAGSSWNRSFARAGMTVKDAPLQRG